ncbi:MAG: DUF4249 domain-containing protein [Bacteroidales bacterium]|nr:DUF4249 domain-containing protein [Bacteroidales bacterium]
MRKIIIYIPVLLILFSACQEKIDLELNEDYQRLVVEGSVTNFDTTQTIKLSKTSSYFTDKQTPRVTGAKVTVTDGQNMFPFIEDSAGIYTSEYPFAGENGKTYRLNIELDTPINNERYYSASEKMPVTLTLDSITAEALQNPPPQVTEDIQIKGWGQEPASPNNYYIWDLYVNGEHYTDTLDERSFTDDELVNGNYIPGLPIFFYDGDDLDTIEVYTQSITGEYYAFLLAFIQEASFGGGNFSGPPANIEGNISNDALGYFCVKAVSKNKTIYMKQ